VGQEGVSEIWRGAFKKGSERILLESDWNPADFNFEGSHRQDVDKVLLNGVLKLAEILEMQPRQVAELVQRNTECFWGRLRTTPLVMTKRSNR